MDFSFTGSLSDSRGRHGGETQVLGQLAERSKSNKDPRMAPNGVFLQTEEERCCEMAAHLLTCQCLQTVMSL